MSLLRRVDLIDRIETDGCVTRFGENKRVADLHLVPLAGFRAEAVIPHESYSIYWTKDGSIIHDFTNETRLEIDESEKDALYAVDVFYDTDEVRVDKDKLTQSHRHLTFAGRCMDVTE